VRDPRLDVDTRRRPPPPAERPDHARLATDFASAVRADSVRAAEAARQSLARRQVTVFGRRVTVGGDSAAAGFRTEAIEARRDVLTMPGDRVMWERLELSKQDGQQARDSNFRERVRATRARNDADRRP
jgi:osmotically-inducible protein OsmY